MHDKLKEKKKAKQGHTKIRPLVPPWWGDRNKTARSKHVASNLKLTFDFLSRFGAGAHNCIIRLYFLHIYYTYFLKFHIHIFFLNEKSVDERVNTDLA